MHDFLSLLPPTPLPRPPHPPTHPATGPGPVLSCLGLLVPSQITQEVRLQGEEPALAWAGLGLPRPGPGQVPCRFRGLGRRVHVSVGSPLIPQAPWTGPAGICDPCPPPCSPGPFTLKPLCEHVQLQACRVLRLDCLHTGHPES